MKTANSLPFYVATAYLISWSFFILLALNHHQIIFLFQDDAAHARLQDIWHAFGGLGPLIAAIATLNIYHGREIRNHFREGYSVRKLGIKGWVLALSPLLILATALVTSRLIQGEWANVSGYIKHNLNNPFSLFSWLLPIFFYGFGEEAGWRGYLLPALQSRYTAFKATVIVSIIWICWHIPTFFYRYELRGAAFLGFILGILAGAIWLTFLFNYTKGSILAVSLWHLTFNLVSMITKDEPVVSAIMSSVIMFLAAFVLVRYKFRNLSPSPKTSLQTATQSQYLKEMAG